MLVDLSSFLHYVCAETMANVLQALGFSLQDNAIISTVVCVGKELTDPVFSTSDLLFDLLGFINGVL